MARSLEQNDINIRLIPLDPLGWKTGKIEGLNSYFLRIADAHGVSPRSLARDTVFPRILTSARPKIWQGAAYWLEPFFIGFGSVPRTWVAALEKLTRLNSLASLTLLSLEGRVAMRNLTARNRRWCGACICESQSNHKAYGHLLWGIRAVEACPWHGTKLESRCICNREAIAPQGNEFLPHLCWRCGSLLGLGRCSHPKGASPREIIRAQLVGKFLTSDLFLGNGRSDPTNDVARFIEGVIKLFGDGVAASIAHLLGVPKASVHGWLHRTHLPTFSQVVDIAEAFDCSIQNVLLGETSSLRLATTNRMYSEPHTSRQARSWLVRKRLEDTLIEDLGGSTPPSLSAVARDLAIDRSHLRRSHPDLAKAIILRHARWRSKAASDRHSERCKAIRESALRLIQSGVIPTRRRIAESLPDTPIFAMAEKRACQEICQEVRQQVGFQIAQTPQENPGG